MRNPFLELIQPDVEVPGTFWATVVGTSPLRVQRDAEPVLAVTPKTLEKVAVGDRVLCLWERRQVIILGRMGGPVTSGNAGNTLDIDGTTYAAAGLQWFPPFTFTNTYQPIYLATLQMPWPYVPPSGWIFDYRVKTTTSFTIASRAGSNSANQTTSVRIIQFGSSSTTALSEIYWQLVKA